MQEYTGQTKRVTNKSSQSWGKLIPVGAYKNFQLAYIIEPPEINLHCQL